MSSPLTHKRTSSSPIPHHHHHPTPLHHHNSQPKPSLTQPHNSTKPNLTTTLYHTQDSIFAVTWARTLFSRSLYIHLLPNTTNIALDDETTTSNSTSTPLFHLQIKPFIFWTKYGSKKVSLPSTNQNQFAYIYYDLSRAKFESGPEPISGFYITIIISSQIALLIGDSPKQTYSKLAKSPNPNRTQITILRREHVYGISNKKYITKATFRGKTRDITIDCTRIISGTSDDSRLCFMVDNKKILVVKHLNWKFRGNERVEMDGVHIQISWDVYNWLFEEENDDNGYALFMFRFEKSGFDYHEDDKYLARLNNAASSGSNSFVGFGSVGFGFGFEKRKMKKGMLRTGAGSSSSSSLSSMSSSGCGSVMEWESVEENELKGPTGFSLLVYAWKS